MCSEGAKLTHHLATAAMCTPSRAAFMTGRYAVRMGKTILRSHDINNCNYFTMKCAGMEGGAHTPPVIVYSSSAAGLPQTETTWAKILQDQGYNTAAFGRN